MSIAGIQLIGALEARASVNLIRFLRDAASWDLRVRWVAQFDAAVDPLALAHLEPPTRVAGRPTEAVSRWRNAHRYGLFYWRRGPDFVLIKDVRDAEKPVYLVIDDPPVLEAFTTLVDPCRLSMMPKVLQEAAEELLAERLILRLEDWAVVLPMRVRIWPIPYAGI